MTDKIKIFLDTDLLEKYLLETTSAEESIQVERYIAMHPEVRKTYTALQENFEAYAKLHAMKTPEGFKETILIKIKQQKRSGSKFFKYAIAASFTALIFAGSSYFFYNQNKNLQEENTLVTNKIKDCLLYTSPSPRDKRQSRMPSSA